MSDNRPAVPAALERTLKEEAGYRCAIPRCGGTVRLEMAHIDPWAKVKEHKFENMICLCGDCHWRYDKLKQIPRLSILQFKRNLSLLSHRYTQVENQVLRHYGKIPSGADLTNYHLPVHPGMTVLVANLVEDGLFEINQPLSMSYINGVPSYLDMAPTVAGSDFITRMVEAGDLEQ